MQVESVLGDKLMPSYPIFVLSILQTIIYVKPINLEQTSYGYCYQSLIHIALVKNANIENENIDTYFNFLSEFAFFLYKNDYVFFDENILNKFFSQYHNQYHISFSFDKLKDTLLKSMIIINQEDQFKFSYKYIYYFLVARKLAEIINKEEGKAEIKNLCANLHKERNANILIFVAHHTKDDYLIEEATFTTMIPFEDVVPITLEPKKDYFYKLIENIVKEISSDIIESNNNPIESRNKILDSQDMLERNSEKHKEDIEKIEQDEDFMSFMMPFYQSFRALQIVGQIVRNRKGSIQTDQLITMIEALYNTAFRTISFWGETLIKTKLNLINSLSSRVNEGDSNKAIEQKINDFFQIAALEICLGVFSQLVHSVGHKDLKDLFDEVAKNIDTPAADIVTFSINSYYGKLSTNDLSKIVVKYEKNPVAMEIIKVRVKSYLYNNYVDYKKKQSFADILKMQLRVLPPR